MSHWYLMGGYATYVWSAYGIVFAVIAGAVMNSLLRLRKIKKVFKDADKT